MSETVVCVHCQHAYNRHMLSCPFCGGENPKEATVNPTPQCPRCNRPLETVDYRGTRLELCPECSGLWLVTDEFEQLTSERDVYTDETIPHGYRKKPPPREEGYLPCPLCNTLMTRKNFKALSAGGKVEMAMADQPWGDYYGSFWDKYGIGWMVNYTDPKK